MENQYYIFQKHINCSDCWHFDVPKMGLHISDLLYIMYNLRKNSHVFLCLFTFRSSNTTSFAFLGVTFHIFIIYNRTRVFGYRINNYSKTRVLIISLWNVTPRHVLETPDVNKENGKVLFHQLYIAYLLFVSVRICELTICYFRIYQ